MGYEISAGAVGKAIGQGIKSFGNYSAQAASRANGVSAGAQSAQGAFNQGSVNNANAIGAERIADQYGFNAAQAAMANQFSLDQFNTAMAFNSKEAQKQREWLEYMESTKYQRAIKDMETAGLNPILAVTGGGVSVGGGGGSAASISAPTGQMASGSTLNGLAASEGNYTGQMEYMGGMLGLLSAAIGGISSAMSALGGLGDFGKSIGESLGNIFSQDNKEANVNSFKDYWSQGRKNQSNKNYTPNYRNGIDWNMKNDSKYSGYKNILNN